MVIEAKRKAILKKIVMSVVLALFILSAILLVACNKQQELRGKLPIDTQTFTNGNMDFSEDNNTQSLLPAPSNWTADTSKSRGKSGNSIVNDMTKITPFTDKGAWDNFKKQVEGKKDRLERQEFFRANFDWTSGYIWAYLDYLEYKDSNNKPFYFSDITNWQQIPAMPQYARDVLRVKDEFKDLKDNEWTEKLESRTFWAENNYQKVTGFIKWVKESSILKDLKPNTHNTTGFEDNKLNSLIMLSNYVSNSKDGTNTSYKSSSIKMPRGTIAKITVDVSTALSTEGDGANITITPTIGSSAQSSIILKKITTTNNTWKQYTIYLRASLYAETSFTVSLGLGRQAGLGSIMGNAEGYAFFDNLTYEIKRADDNDFKNQFTNGSEKLKPYQDTIVDIATSSKIEVAYDCNLTDTTSAFIPTANDEISTKQTPGNSNNPKSTFNDYFNNDKTVSVNQPSMSDQFPTLTLNNQTNITDNPNFTGFVGIPSTVEGFIRQKINNQNTPTFSLEQNQYAIVGMWVNSTVTTTINLVETNSLDSNSQTIANPNFPKTVSSITVKTDDLNPVNIVDDKNGIEANIYSPDPTNESVKEKWQYVQFFVKTGAIGKGIKAQFTINLQIGLTSFDANTSLSSFSYGQTKIYQPNVQLNVDVKQYNMHTTDDYCKEATLEGSSNTGNGFSRANTIATSSVEIAEQSAIDTINNYAAVDFVKNTSNSSTTENNNMPLVANMARTAGVKPSHIDYTGAVGGTKPVVGMSGNAVNSTIPTHTGWLDKDTIQDTDFTTNFSSLATIIKNWKENQSTSPLLSSKSPLLIAGQNYGYLANTPTSLTSNGYFSVNLRLLIANNATANIYLVDVTDEKDKDKLGSQILETSIGSNYRYDNDGNVVTSYDINKANIIFYLQSNGLWTTSASNRGPYFANLANYKKQTDTTHSEYNAKNLVDEKGDIIYYYRDDYNGMPQYTRTLKKNDTDFVQDFSAAVKNDLITQEQLNSAMLRSQDNSKKYELMASVTGQKDTSKSIDTETNWTNVNFFIANGSTERKYRLEVFLGDRNGSTTTTVNSTDWVIYETVKTEALNEEKFNNIISEYQSKFIATSSNQSETIKEIENKNDKFTVSVANKDNTSITNSMEFWHYSIYDSGYYAPYNAKTSNLTGNPYASYNPSTYKKQLAFMQFKEDYAITTIANFKAIENNVASTSVSPTPSKVAAKFTGNIPLLITSSILIAAILTAVIVLLCRRLLKNRKANPKKAKNMQPKNKTVSKGNSSTKSINNTTDVLPDKDEITSEELYDFNTEDNNNPIVQEDALTEKDNDLTVIEETIIEKDTPIIDKNSLIEEKNTPNMNEDSLNEENDQ